MKYKKIKRMAAVLCFFTVCTLTIHSVCRLLERKESRVEYSQFWENPGDYDVWLLGTSHVRRSMQVMELWKDYGIYSYSLAAASSYITQTYWTFMNALDYGTPKVVVMDCYKTGNDAKISSSSIVERMHTGMDSIPFSRTKVQMVMDLFESPAQRMEFLFNFYIYHNRWEELGPEDFRPESSPFKGCRIISNVQDLSGYHLIDQSDRSCEDTVGFRYLRKIIEECQKRDISIVLTAVPCCLEDEIQRSMNGAADMAQEYGVPFLNMSYDEALDLDYQVDFSDKSHLNWLGAQKSTDYMGKYLTTHYDLSTPDASQDQESRWSRDYIRYQDAKRKLLQQEPRLDAYLVWLSDEAYTCDIYQSDSQILQSDPILAKLLGKVHSRHSITRQEARNMLGKKITGDVVFCVKDAQHGYIVDKAVFKDRRRR